MSGESQYINPYGNYVPVFYQYSRVLSATTTILLLFNIEYYIIIIVIIIFSYRRHFSAQYCNYGTLLAGRLYTTVQLLII